MTPEQRAAILKKCVWNYDIVSTLLDIIAAQSEALSIINDNAEIAGVNVDTRVAHQALARTASALNKLGES